MSAIKFRTRLTKFMITVNRTLPKNFGSKSFATIVDDTRLTKFMITVALLRNFGGKNFAITVDDT